jgi:uncharacterized protein YndB with AHSA1/START domain
VIDVQRWLISTGNPSIAEDPRPPVGQTVTPLRTRASRVIKARPEELYGAFLDPTALIDWLPPAEMTGEIHEFAAEVGGGYRVSLFYPPDERVFRGKTSDREDMVNLRFVELAPHAGSSKPSASSLPIPSSSVR